MNGKGWKIIAVLVGSIVVVFMGALGFVSGQASSATNGLVVLTEKHHDDLADIRERMGKAESFEAEVLRRLDRIERNQEGK